MNFKYLNQIVLINIYRLLLGLFYLFIKAICLNYVKFEFAVHVLNIRNLRSSNAFA